MSDWQQPQPFDRCEGLRADPSWVAAAWVDPQAQVVGVDAEGRLNTSASGIVMLAPTGPYEPQLHHLIGIRGGAPTFAALIEVGDTSLRAVMDSLPPAELQLALTAVGLIGWHRRAGFCPNCGSATNPSDGGLVRRCPSCGLEDYPRSDAAVIVAITDSADRLLLARQPTWPPHRYSVLAGFAEVGESLEQVVHREVGEEVGLEVTGVRYLGSQPWPFPRSLMVAFAASALGTELHPAVGEIEDAGWFSRAELQTALESGAVELPAVASISRRMIQAWLAEDLSAEGVG